MSLDVFSASAGTGKTYNICEELARRIEAGLDPRRVLACSYTKAAAAELKQRVQKKLLETGQIAAAEALEVALIGTVHSVGLQLLSRFAVRAGLSPDLRVIPEDREDSALSALIGQAEYSQWGRFAGHAARLSLSDTLPLELIKEKRKNFISDADFAGQLRQGLADTLGFLGAGGSPAGTLADAYAEAATVARTVLLFFDRVPTAKAEPCYTAVLDFSRSPVRTWYGIAKLAKLKGNKKPGTEAALQPLQAIATRVRRHPALAAELTGYTEALIEVTLALDARYRAYKTERGFVDYTDIEEQFLLLARNEDVARDLAKELHLVVVDEFQDTNPVQLAIFQRLAQIAAGSLWVGDPKQAIFGFSGTDPALMNAVMAKTKGIKKRTLSENNRSCATLVDLFNQLFVPVFGEDARVTPKHPPIEKATERWLLEATNNENEHAALAEGVLELIRSGVAPRNVAILVRSNRYGKEVAALLRSVGIPTQVEMGGLLRTRECALAVAALRIVSDRQDGIAAAQVLHLLGQRDWLESRLAEGRDKMPFEGHPILAPLEALDAKRLSPALAVAAVIDRLELPTRVASWGEAGGRCASLDSLLALAREFEESTASAGAACTLGGFLNWLEEAADKGEDTRRPQLGIDAVTLVTYHSAKGLQWPVVILAELDKVFDPRLWEPTVTGGQPEKGEPLKGRTLRYWPWPFGRNEPFSHKLNDPLGIQVEVLASTAGAAVKEREDAECVRLLYVGFTRARDRLILASRYDSKKDKHTHKWLDLLATSQNIFSGKALGENKLEGKAGILTVRVVEPPKVPTAKPAPKAERWLQTPAKPAVATTPRFLNPSDASPVDSRLEPEPLPGPSPFMGAVKTDDPAALGDACHAYFASLVSTRGADPKIRLAVAERLLTRHTVNTALTPVQLVAAGDRLEAWVANRYPGAIWHPELALHGSQGGSIVDGEADLILETATGMVVIDHKVTGGDPLEACKPYTGQLAVYGGCSKSAEAWFHLPIIGVMVRST